MHFTFLVIVITVPVNFTAHKDFRWSFVQNISTTYQCRFLMACF